ncbi:MAG: Xaa-Pro peptidase family protein [Kiritimatiellae bacterium]|jgi:Xaa-Pro dipeptidase|nr:Xaa-Pro peptidase family protein [Kiritimatiellia bacterium]
MFQVDDQVLMEDLKLRCSKVQSAMADCGLDAILISTNLNNLYLSGRIFAGFTYLQVEGKPLFFLKRQAGFTGDNVYEIRKPEQIPEILMELGLSLPGCVGLESGAVSHSSWLRLSALFPGAILKDCSALLAEARAVKTPYEITLMKKTGSRHAAVINQFPSVYEPGMTDQQWMTEMVGLMLKAGSLGIFRVAGESMEAFMGTLLAGDNGGAVSPYDFAMGGAGMHPSYPVGQCGIKLEQGMAVMADIAANFYGYLTDCSRIFSVGRLAQRALDAHSLSIDIHNAIAAKGVPGTACEDLYNSARNMAEQAGFADCFMGGAHKARFVGHGTGLVINEQPVLGARSKSILQEGMCVALEPKFYIAGTGAVGPEDTYLVTAKGLQCLTSSSREIVEL